VPGQRACQVPTGSEIDEVREDLLGRWQHTTRAVMAPLSLHDLPQAQIAELLDCHAATVRRWISRSNREGLARVADRGPGGPGCAGGG
jgi:DNA-directed RNA polymerase specialized sigma24 family protein